MSLRQEWLHSCSTGTRACMRAEGQWAMGMACTPYRATAKNSFMLPCLYSHSFRFNCLQVAPAWPHHTRCLIVLATVKHAVAGTHAGWLQETCLLSQVMVCTAIQHICTTVLLNWGGLASLPRLAWAWISSMKWRFTLVLPTNQVSHSCG